MFAIILAGGRGERLMPLTQDVPKPLVEVAGKSMLEHQIAQAKKAGIDNFIILESYLAKKIQERIGDGSNYGISATHLELPFELGSAGAIRSGLKLLPKSEDDVLIMYGDVLSNVDLSGMIDQSRKNKSLVTDLGVQWQIPYGVLQEGNIHHPVLEKPTISVNGALYVLRKELWNPYNSFPEKGDFSRDVVEGLTGLYVDHYKHDGFWAAIDTPQHIAQAELSRDKWVIQETISTHPERK